MNMEMSKEEVDKAIEIKQKERELNTMVAA